MTEEFLTNFLAAIMAGFGAYYFWTQYTGGKIGSLPKRPPKKAKPITISLAAYQHFQPQLKALYFTHGQTPNLEITEGIAIIAEPRNQADRNTIAVHLEGKKIGYIPTDKAEQISSMLTRQKVVKLIQAQDYIKAELTLK